MASEYHTPWLGRFVRTTAFVAALVCLWQAAGWVRPVRATVASSQTPSLKTQPIAALRIGQRVLADNPELNGPALPDTPIDPAAWRLIRLDMPKPAGGSIEIELLRPVEWFLDQALEVVDADPIALLPRPLTVAATELPLCELLVERTIRLDLPELGAHGPATVTAVAACPPLASARGPGRRLITGTFRHSAGNVLDVQIAGEPAPLGVTDNHPFWSEDRQSFIPAGELRPGERLRKADQTLTQVTRITPRTGPPVPLFNLEVDAEHVYHVGTGGVLVHNSYKTFITYIGTDLKTGLPYVGRASGVGTPQQILARRLSRHHKKLSSETDWVNSTTSYAAIRGQEERLIREFGLDNLANEINGISPRNSKIDEYLRAAMEEFGEF